MKNETWGSDQKKSMVAEDGDNRSKKNYCKAEKSARVMLFSPRSKVALLNKSSV